MNEVMGVGQGDMGELMKQMQKKSNPKEPKGKE
jgi:hypothetical protein